MHVVGPIPRAASFLCMVYLSSVIGTRIAFSSDVGGHTLGGSACTYAGLVTDTCHACLGRGGGSDSIQPGRLRRELGEGGGGGGSLDPARLLLGAESGALEASETRGGENPVSLDIGRVLIILFLLSEVSCRGTNSQAGACRSSLTHDSSVGSVECWTRSARREAALSC